MDNKHKREWRSKVMGNRGTDTVIAPDPKDMDRFVEVLLKTPRYRTTIATLSRLSKARSCILVCEVEHKTMLETSQGRTSDMLLCTLYSVAYSSPSTMVNGLVVTRSIRSCGEIFVFCKQSDHISWSEYNVEWTQEDDKRVSEIRSYFFSVVLDREGEWLVLSPSNIRPIKLPLILNQITMRELVERTLDTYPYLLEHICTIVRMLGPSKGTLVVNFLPSTTDMQYIIHYAEEGSYGDVVRQQELTRQGVISQSLDVPIVLFAATGVCGLVGYVTDVSRFWKRSDTLEHLREEDKVVFDEFSSGRACILVDGNQKRGIVQFGLYQNII